MTAWRGNPHTGRDPSMSQRTETTNRMWTGSSIHVIKIKNWNSSCIGKAMMTWIVPGSQNQISAMPKKLWQTSITQTPQHPGPFPFHQRTSYCYSKRGRSLLWLFTPSKYLLIAWKLIFREGVVLWLDTYNSITMDLVVFLFLYLIQLTYDSHAAPMLLFSFHTHASCTPHSIHLHAVHGYVLPFFSSILPLPCGCLMFYFLSISWPCLIHTPTSCY